MNAGMKILLTSVVDLKKTTFSRTHQFIKHLVRNHEVTALCLNAWWMKKEDGSRLYGEDYYNWYFDDIKEKVDVTYFSDKEVAPVLQEAIFPLKVNRLLKKVDAERFDLHINSNAINSGYFVARQLNSLGIPTILDIADDLPRRIRTSLYVPSPIRPLAGLMGQVMFNENIKISQKITYITKGLMDSYNFPNGKSTLVPNGVDIGIFRPKISQDFRKERGIDHDFVLGFIGTLIDWVDFIPVFSSMRELSKKEIPNIKMMVVGGEGRLKENKELAKKCGVADRIIFTGTTPYTQGPDDIACMDICLICRRPTPDSHNALPLKLFEYMACGKPVISTRLNGVREAVGDRVLYASSAEEFKEQILELYHNEELRESMGREGRKFVERYYSWDSACRQFENVLVNTCKYR